MYEDNPMALVMQKWQERYFGDNSYGRPIIGTIDNINCFNQDMLFEHKKNLYTKDNLIIVISGKIEDKDAITQQISDIFASLPDHKNGEIPAFPKNHLPAEQSAHFDKKTEQNHLIIAFPGFDGNNPQRYAANILATYMGGNMSSRLFQNIREKQGLCYYISARNYSSQNHGQIIIRAGIDKERFDFGVEKIYEELEAIAN
jgi:predicted Zn-dependent peptidase